jgi:hypothetical protein
MKRTKNFEYMTGYWITKCDSINSYLCLHLSKLSSVHILVLNCKDDIFAHDEFVKSWRALSKAEFIRHTFPTQARTAGVLAGCISKLVTQMSRKTPSTSAVTSMAGGMSGRSLVTDAQNMLRGSPKPMLEAPKSSGKWGGKGSKGSGTPTEESTPESASTKFMKKFFISTPGSNSLRHDDYEDLFVEHKAMYGNFYYFGIDDKRSVDI